MISSPETLLQWAKIITPKGKADWFEAMRCEMAAIPDKRQHYGFALGCLKAVLFEAARSRKGLQYMARFCGAFMLFAICCFALNKASVYINTPGEVAVSKLITKLCWLYMCGAGLLLISLKGLRLYAAAGLGIALCIIGYLYIWPQDYGTLSHHFLIALFIETSMLMLILLCISIYLNLLYTPDYDAA